ncbi:hypothetical protein MNBD_ALPHA11-1391 [hydrothermal vent metagenome]|uniref:Thioredoxin-like fold domain-containing protein n=1 Tax=hydrothermal vent metagenome TaxID=652676 RepID=A0A3B0TEN9_9ZZZZ
MNITRRNAMILTAAASTSSFLGVSNAAAGHDAASGGAAGAPVEFTIQSLMSPKGWSDRAILGSEDATVTVIEYTSPTCPFCAAFHNDTYPQFKTDFVDSGKAKFIVRPFARNVLDAVVFMLSDVAGEDMYHNVLNTYFSSQHIWSRSETPRDAMLAVALELGFTEESFENALTNQELFAALELTRDQALEEFGLTGTPTFYINGKMLSGNKTLQEMAAEINPLLG